MTDKTQSNLKKAKKDSKETGFTFCENHPKCAEFLFCGICSKIICKESIYKHCETHDSSPDGAKLKTLPSALRDLIYSLKQENIALDEEISTLEKGLEASADVKKSQELDALKRKAIDLVDDFFKKKMKTECSELFILKATLSEAKLKRAFNSKLEGKLSETDSQRLQAAFSQYHQNKKQSQGFRKASAM